MCVTVDARCRCVWTQAVMFMFKCVSNDRELSLIPLCFIVQLYVCVCDSFLCVYYRSLYCFSTTLDYAIQIISYVCIS